MVIRKLHAGRRRGAVAVETAVIIGLVAMLVFGIFEYCPALDGLEPAQQRRPGRLPLRPGRTTRARRSARTFRQIVTSYMAGETTSFSNFTVTVSGTHLGVSTPVNNLAAG